MADPVFVLCMGRSGSTLLRFLLDAHPELACPPETSLPALCGQLAVVWSLIEGAPLSANRGDPPPQVPDAAIEGIRRMLDEMTRGVPGTAGQEAILRQEPRLGADRGPAAADLPSAMESPPAALSSFLGLATGNPGPLPRAGDHAVSGAEAPPSAALPLEQLPPMVRAQVNDLLGVLGYPPLVPGQAKARGAAA